MTLYVERNIKCVREKKIFCFQMLSHILSHNEDEASHHCILDISKSMHVS